MTDAEKSPDARVCVRTSLVGRLSRRRWRAGHPQASRRCLDRALFHRPDNSGSRLKFRWSRRHNASAAIVSPSPRPISLADYFTG